MGDRLIIKKGNMELVSTLRSNLISVDSSHDGIVFVFNGGFLLNYTDSYMPIFTKDIIKNTSNSFPTANLIFDLANYNKPVMAEPTKK